MTNLLRLIPFDWERLIHKHPRTWDFIKKYWKDGVWIAVIVVLIVGTGLFFNGRKTRKTINLPAPETGLTIQSPAFAGRRGGDAIPARYTADGLDYSPPLYFVNVPEGAAELALIMEDRDAAPEPFVHWLVYGIDPRAGGLFEGYPAPQAPQPEATAPAPARVPGGPRIKAPEKPPEKSVWAPQGVNSFGTLGYRGPSQAPGSGTRRYHFRLYALNATLGAGPGLTKAELLGLMQGKIVEESELVGTYRR